MKKLLLVFSVLTFVFALSCEDSVNPKADAIKGYSFYCIINADTTFQTAYLSRTYDVPGLDPLGNTTDPSQKNARILLAYKAVGTDGILENRSCLFRDTSVERNDNQRYKSDLNFYYNNKFSIKSTSTFDTAQPIAVTVQTSDNKILTSSTETIPTGDMYFEQVKYVFPPVNPKSKACDYIWFFYSAKNSISKYYYLPTLELNYSKVENGIPVRKKIAVPCKTIYSDNKEILGYPGVSNKNIASYMIHYIESAFAKISEGDLAKYNYIIHNLTLNVKIMDKNLASYMASGSTFNDEFTVRIDAADVSNITGGYGLFGLYACKKKEITINKDFLKSLGYGYDPKL